MLSSLSGGLSPLEHMFGIYVQIMLPLTMLHIGRKARHLQLHVFHSPLQCGSLAKGTKHAIENNARADVGISHGDNNRFCSMEMVNCIGMYKNTTHCNVQREQTIRYYSFTQTQLQMLLLFPYEISLVLRHSKYRFDCNKTHMTM